MFGVDISPTARMGSLPGRPAADRGDRQGRPHRRPGRDARRAHLGHLRARGRGPLRHRPPAARPRCRDGVHHPQDGRDPRHRRPRGGASRRRADPRRAAHRGHRRRHRHRDDRPRTRRAVPRSRRSRSPTPCSRSATCRSTAPRSRCRSRSAPARSSGSPVWSARDEPNCWRPSSAPGTPVPVRSSVRGTTRQAQRSRGRDHRGHGDGARGSQDLRRRAVDERARQRIAAAAVVVQRRRVAEGQVPHQGRLRRDEVRAAAQQRDGPTRRHALGRKPAEGRAGPVVDRRGQRAAARRADPRGRRRRAQRDLPHHHRIRRGRHGGGDGVVGHARDHRAVAPRVRHARRRVRRRTRPRRPRPSGGPGIRVPDGDCTRRTRHAEPHPVQASADHRRQQS